MTAGTGRADVLRKARRNDSITKRQRVLQTIADLEGRGDPISFASIARNARVSTWLVYADGVREHVHAARARQAAQPAADRRAGLSASPASLRTDLELARQEITALRVERDQLREGMRRHLGRDLEALGSAGLAGRVDELTRNNQRLAEQVHQLNAAHEASQTRADGLETDLAAARTSLRRMMRDQNTGL